MSVSVWCGVVVELVLGLGARHLVGGPIHLPLGLFLSIFFDNYKILMVTC